MFHLKNGMILNLQIWLIFCLMIFISIHVFMLSPFSHVRLFATLWTIALQASLSMGFSRQEYWSGLPCPPAGDLPDPGVKLTSLVSHLLASKFFTTSATWEALFMNIELVLKSRAGSLLLSSFLHHNYAVYMKKILFSMQVFIVFLLLISSLHLNSLLR